MSASPVDPDLTRLAVHTIKMLAVDAVEKANSGHPGMPMGAADYSFLLWNRFLQYSAKNPRWPNRDRFVLSAGHGSMLLYSLLHLSGFDLSLDELKNFRQWGSKTPGHPEFGLTPGVEATTGPLGQGFGNGVGMALAARMMGAKFNRNDFSPIDHAVYGIVSDGDLMEGVASESASLAGHLKLGNLIYIYDDNQITIDGETKITYSEDVAGRFNAYGWHTRRIDGHNHEQIVKALDQARKEIDRPSLILARTHIGHGAPNKQDSASSHGAALGPDEVAATKKAHAWPGEPTFHVPDAVRRVFSDRTAQNEKACIDWENQLKQWKKKYPDLAREWDAHWDRTVPKDILKNLSDSLPTMPNATRSISSQIQQKVAEWVPALTGGSADLVSSTKTAIKNSTDISSESFAGRNIHFGIREHGMGAVMNGMALYGSWIPFGSTFLMFSDYMRPAIRLAALSKLQTIYMFTHDSILLGEDGPTHQPVEHLGSLRLIPNLAVVRPADSLECAASWQIALERKDGPTALILTRQNLPDPKECGADKVGLNDLLRGAYIVAKSSKLQPDLILVASGSELHLALEAKKEFDTKGTNTRVVSMLCMDTFAKQKESFQEMLLPADEVPIVAIEAARGDLWHRWIGKNGLVIGVDTFGESAPDHVLAEKFGFTAPQIVEKVERWLESRKK